MYFQIGNNTAHSPALNYCTTGGREREERFHSGLIINRREGIRKKDGNHGTQRYNKHGKLTFCPLISPHLLYPDLNQQAILLRKISIANICSQALNKNHIYYIKHI